MLNRIRLSFEPLEIYHHAPLALIPSSCSLHNQFSAFFTVSVQKFIDFVHFQLTPDPQALFSPSTSSPKTAKLVISGGPPRTWRQSDEKFVTNEEDTGPWEGHITFSVPCATVLDHYSWYLGRCRKNEWVACGKRHEKWAEVARLTQKLRGKIITEPNS